MAPADSDRHDDDTRQLLAGRLRAGLWLSILCIVAFALSDPVVHPDLVRQLYGVVGIELAVVLGAIWLVRLATRPWHTAQGAEVTVSDTGPGVSPEAAARLFEPCGAAFHVELPPPRGAPGVAA
jgi:hypothetical protein